MVSVSGKDVELKTSDAIFHRYKYYILGDAKSITEDDFLRKATTVEAVDFLVKLFKLDIEVNDDNCVELFYDIHPYILNKEVELTGQEAYQKLKEMKWRQQQSQV